MTVWVEIFGERYGIPSDIPLRINKPARRMAKTGIAFVSFFLIPRLMNFPKTDIANIAGKVPNPNRIITRVPEIASPEATAAAKPM